MSGRAINEAIRHRDYDMPTTGVRSFATTASPKFVFVGAIFGAASLETAKRRGEKPCLHDQSSAPRSSAAPGSTCRGQDAQTCLLLLVRRKLSKPRHFRDQTRPDAKWRFETAISCGPAGHAEA